jgi:hypothetical protein
MAEPIPVLRSEGFGVKTQWSPLLLFLGLLVAGIALWVVMMMRYGFFKNAGATEE